MSQQSEPNETPETSPGEEGPTLGEDGRPIRVINFAGGHFDTIMQLGVTHALLVIQGRAPDAVVGLSAGAIQAAALAEILQAGEELETKEKESEDQQRDEQDAQLGKIGRFKHRMAVRVARFRHFLNACQRAPEEILDAALPDAYQIDARRPLQPLRVPRFAKLERERRQEELSARSGLIALYNHLLGLHLPIGTIARATRRILGWVAAEEIEAKVGRHAVRMMEGFRLLLLVGSDLARIVPFGWVLVRPLFLTSTKPQAGTAGDLMFRFRSWQFMVAAVRNSIAFVVLAGLWVGLSALPAALVWEFWLTDSGSPEGMAMLYLAVPYLLLLVLGFARALAMHDHTTRSLALWNVVKGLLQLLFLLTGWSVALLLITVTVSILLSGQPAFETIIGWLSSDTLWVWLSLIAPSLLFGLWVLLLFLGHRLFTAKTSGSPTTGFKDWYFKRLLRSYNLNKSLLHPHGLEFFLAPLFDPDYYGSMKVNEAVENSLRERVDVSPRGVEEDIAAQRKKVGYYGDPARSPRIHLGLAVANIATKAIEVVPEDESILSGLLAANAKVPYLPVHACGEKRFVDATNVTQVPMPALLSLLRKHKIDPKAPIIHVYRVATVPFSSPALREVPRRRSDESSSYLNLLDIALRALRLRKFRDADLERRLTHAYTRAIPPRDPDTGRLRAVATLTGKDGSKDRHYYRMWVAPIELETPVELAANILSESKEDRRTEILRTVASGCRAAMQVMLADSIEQLSEGSEASRVVKCAAAVRHHFVSKGKAVKAYTDVPMPGSKPTTDDADDVDGPPGLWEVCQHCTLLDPNIEAENESELVPKPESKGQSKHKTGAEPAREQVISYSLKRQTWEKMAPSWPHEKEKGAEPDSTSVRYFEATKAKAETSLSEVYPTLKSTWPHDANKVPDGKLVERPMVSLLFSGGVFRGVFQVGVLNALSELNVRPDIVAGASIGSITAAMSAEVLAVEHEDPVSRRRQIARIAATYLAVDRIILTDRFADFIREWTIRAADTRFSLRQADTLFRKYDRTGSNTFGRSARQVVAGLERLFYISPFQLLQLARALRARQLRRAGRLARKLGQQWLNRMQVGEETLGADALKQLIEHFVIQRLKGAPAAAEHELPAGVFGDFLANGVLMLATCTDLTKGRLLTLGDPFAAASESRGVDLLEALLASSAFPGVFRPRWSQELFPESYLLSQFIDGGVMDNLPIDAVVQSLWKASCSSDESGLVRRRPSQQRSGAHEDAKFSAPHLVLVASLEANVHRITEESSAREMEDYWPALAARAKKLGYNKKLTIYEHAAREINAWATATADLQSDERLETSCPGEAPPLDLDIVAIKPNWLCGTFAFHPMLGYRRRKQAESIAHGCASTLLQIGQCPRGHLQAWGVQIDRLPAATKFEEAAVSADRWRAYSGEGACWLSPGKQCPFSELALRGLNASTTDCAEQIENKTIAELAVIHEVCGSLKTHIRR